MRLSKPLFISIRTKFIVLFCMMITLPFLLSGILTYQKYSANVERDARAYSEQIAEQISINLERYVKEMERITLALYYDDSVMEILEHHSGSNPNDNTYIKVEEKSRMSQLLSSVIIEKTEVEGVFVFALDGSLFSNLQETVRTGWLPESNRWMKQAKVKDGGMVIIPPDEGTYYLDMPKEVLSLSRLVKDPVSNRDLGYVKVDLTSEGFEKIISSVQVTENSKLYVFNESYRKIYPFSMEEGDSYADLVDTASDEFMVSQHTSEYGGLHIVSVVPNNDLLADAKQLTRFTMGISAASLIMAYLAAVLASNMFVKPIRHLQKKMRRVQNGDFQERAEFQSHDEIGLLTEGFNSMVSQLDRMIKDMYELRLREKESELAALQSQINPHFLYNTLESISMVAYKDRNEGLSQVITSLGRMLRYTVNHNERLVYLKDELAFVENYLDIQSFRLENRLYTEILVDFSHEYAIVPKLILQPLLENAIEHGLGQEPLRVTITSKAIDQDLYIYIKDNGKGIAPECRRSIERRMTEKENMAFEPQAKKTKGFALRNIHQRLQILYGAAYGLTIEETGMEGTMFCIRIPFQWEE